MTSQMSYHSSSSLNGISAELSALEAQVQNKLEWKYEMRREAQEILPGLFIGPFQPSWKLEALQALGITHVLCIAESREQSVQSVSPRADFGS
jgi:serine/threonine/tyrosine-interacting protein